MKTTDTCNRCSKTAELVLVDKHLCNNCFSRLIEQKIKKNLREYRLTKGMKLSITDEGCKYIIEKIINLPIEIVDEPESADKIILPWTLDDENEEFLGRMFEDKKLVVPDDENKVKLFKTLSRTDMKNYFKIKKVKYTVEKTELGNMIDKLEKKYPGLKTSLLKSQEKIKELIK